MTAHWIFVKNDLDFRFSLDGVQKEKGATSPPPKKDLSKCRVSYFRNRGLSECTIIIYFFLKYPDIFTDKINFLILFFYLLIVKQIEAFQRSGIQLENGNFGALVHYEALTQLQSSSAGVSLGPLISLYQGNPLAANFLINTGELGEH